MFKKNLLVLLVLCCFFSARVQGQNASFVIDLAVNHVRNEYAIGYRDRSVEVYDLATQALRYSITPTEGDLEFFNNTPYLQELEYSPDGRYLAVDNHINLHYSYIDVYDAHAGIKLYQIEGSSGCGTKIVWHPNSRIIVSLGYTACLTSGWPTLDVWEIETSKNLHHELLSRSGDGQGGGMGSGAFTHDGSQFIFNHLSYLLMYDTKTWQTITQWTAVDGLDSMALTADDALVIGADHTGLMHVWERQTGTLLHSLMSSTATPFSRESSLRAKLTVSSDGFAAVSYSAEIVVWDLSTQQIISQTPATEVAGMDWLSDGALIYVTQEGQNATIIAPTEIHGSSVPLTP
jgi:WD40 repeat protein